MNNQNAISNNKTVFFLHIPKTGGVTLRQIIFNNYEKESTYIIKGIVKDGIAKFKSLSSEEKSKINLFQGHIFFGMHKFTPNQFTYITLLRDPIDRIVSSYYYMLNTLTHPLHKKVVENGSFEDFLKAKQFYFHNNCYVRMLSGLERVAYGKCSKDMLEIARYNIKHYFSVVGTTEEFDTFLVLCGQNLGWKINNYRKENVTKKRPAKHEISQEARKIMIRDNMLDIELYNLVKENIVTKQESTRLHKNLNFG